MSVSTKDDNWKTFKMPFGEHKGETLYMIYLNSYSFIPWLYEQDPQWPGVCDMLEKAIEYRNIHDPWKN